MKWNNGHFFMMINFFKTKKYRISVTGEEEPRRVYGQNRRWAPSTRYAKNQFHFNIYRKRKNEKNNSKINLICAAEEEQAKVDERGKIMAEVDQCKENDAALRYRNISIFFNYTSINTYSMKLISIGQARERASSWAGEGRCGGDFHAEEVHPVPRGRGRGRPQGRRSGGGRPAQEAERDRPWAGVLQGEARALLWKEEQRLPQVRLYPYRQEQPRQALCLHHRHHKGMIDNDADFFNELKN